ncbi:MAG: NnrS family protein [Comamonadaceae bacterium]|nr:NnrS family protein [Comamonadaceae bacterium]
MLNTVRWPAWTSAAHPVWMCGMRPFFVATAASAVLLMALWVLFLSAGWPLPASAGGPVAWHAHELLFGFALASVLGFLLTALPEFTGTPDFSPATVRRLVALWLAARVAFWASGVGAAPMVLLSGLLHVGLIGGLAVLAAPRLWADPQRKHLSFLWTLLALGLCAAGFHAELLLGSASANRWLLASVGVYMVLIVVALSRISMRIVNQALQDAGHSTDYLARPPRRNLLITVIVFYTVAEFAFPGSRLSGWLALAAAAAVFHLMNDWHVGRALLRRWPLMLYAIYVCMGLGYGLMGAGLLLPLGTLSGGRHLLTVGALGLAMLGAMSIAGRAHCGLQAEQRDWVPLAALSLCLAAAVRAAAGWLLADPLAAWALAGAVWCLGFGLYLVYLAPVLLARRSDGHGGCHGVEEV